ncbi:DUF559 domain-containing protein [Agromyces sp. NPDC058110]|uniref:DUF559 domain-containing protein n=1 Tax=Agromyces sp. NPDC058110 TaxID=3346345 RepID=UPI0036DB26EB
MHPVRRAFHDLPLARTADLHRRGIGQHAIRLALRSGTIDRVRQGVYAVAGAPRELVVAAAHGGVPGCVTAARLLGLWVLDVDDVPHIAVAAGDRVHAHDGCRCVTHRVSGVRLGRTTTCVRTLLQLFACRGDEAFFVALESALRQRLVPPAMLEDLQRRLPARARWMLDVARDDADSGLESLLRLRLREHGIDLRSQVSIAGVGRVDFLLGDRVILEVDGRANHDGPSMRHKDLVRDAIAAGLGFTTLRFDYALVMHDWPTVLSAILTTIDLGLHRSRRPAAG